MARISEQTIELVRSTADIVDVISSYIELKKKGTNFFGLCPFHGEKTPSFSVNQDKQIFKCFGCGAGGGVINFVMEIDSLQFIDAVEKLGTMYNIKIETNRIDTRTKNLKEQLIEINQLSTNYYSNQLYKDDTIKNYLYKRNFNDDMIKLFQLGCSNKSSSKLLELLQSKTFSSESMKKSGLFIDGKNGYFERFVARLIFPISNQTGDIIAFAGRDLSNKENIAKYINSPETPIYNKSKTFYGLHLAKEFIRKEKFIIIVEGYFDLIRLYQNNIKNVIAISGTSFTDIHASIIKQYSKNIFIAFDGDAAGKKAAIRTGYTLLKNLVNPKILLLPEGTDPDDWIDNKGISPFKESLENAKTVIEFNYNFSVTNEKIDNNIVIEDIINEIALIKDPVFREITAKHLSEIVNISEQSIIMSLNNKLSKKQRFDSIKEAKNELNPNKETNFLLEDDFIRLCLNINDKIRKIIFEDMNKDWLKSQIHLNIYDYLYIHLNSKDEIPINLIINKITDNETRNKLTDLSITSNKVEYNEESVFNCLIQLEKTYIQSKLELLKNSLKTVNDNDSLTKTLTEISSLEKNIVELESKYK